MSPESSQAAAASSAEVAVPPLPPGSDRADIVGTAAWAAAGGPPLTRWQRLDQLRLALGRTSPTCQPRSVGSSRRSGCCQPRR